ncbi:MAG: hypothetical protein LBE80_10340 [Deltaproteobacteria bacterium]|nr:hypothetical protein [Deltaproteobacteria bacterium]
MPLKKYEKIHEALWAHPHWIDDYLLSDDCLIEDQEEFDIITGWRDHFLKRHFFVLKQLGRYAAVMSVEKPPRLFGVTGLSQSLEKAAPCPLPFLAALVLLPFKDKIVYDGFCEAYPDQIDPESLDLLNQDYERLKKSQGFIVKLTK